MKNFRLYYVKDVVAACGCSGAGACSADGDFVGAARIKPEVRFSRLICLRCKTWARTLILSLRSLGLCPANLLIVFFSCFTYHQRACSHGAATLAVPAITPPGSQRLPINAATRRGDFPYDSVALLGLMCLCCGLSGTTMTYYRVPCCACRAAVVNVRYSKLIAKQIYSS